MIRSLMLWALVAVIPLLAAEADPNDQGYRPWPDEAVLNLRAIPVQEAGRVKPLSTAAAFTLLRLSGRRSLRHDGHTLEPTAWIMDVLLRPEVASRQALFQIQTSEVLDAVGIDHAGKQKRDRYSYRELLEGRPRIRARASDIARIDEDDRDYLDEQILDLDRNLRSFEAWLDGGRAFHWRLDPGDNEVLRRFFPAGPVPIQEVVPLVPTMLEGIQRLETLEGEDLRTYVRTSLARALDPVVMMIRSPAQPAWVAPLDRHDENWLSSAELIDALIQEGEEPWRERVELLELWQQVWESRDNPDGFVAATGDLRASLTRQAALRGEYRKVASEDHYYRMDLLTKSLVLFLLAFLAVAALWIRPTNRWFAGAVWSLTAAALLLLVVVITWRCYLRARPPVSTLYETVLFITACNVAVALVVERLTRVRVALSLAPILGAVGLFLAFRYETTEAADTMPQLVAVLDTNFWLSTHVTTVTLGYAAGLKAGVVGAIYLVGRLVGWKRDDPEFYRVLGRVTYGILAFGLVFSVVGTILGGIWANDSWGRFWGWDPKENGALMIVLAELAIIHARIAGWLRDPGTCLAAVANFAVVVFSWWHVNQLGAGLHSYGHTDGVMRAILIAYVCVAVALALGGTAILLDRRRAAAARIN